MWDVHIRAGSPQHITQQIATHEHSGSFPIGKPARNAVRIADMYPGVGKHSLFQGYPRQRFLELNGLVLGECYAKAGRELCTEVE